MKSTRHSIVVAALLVTIAGQGASAADKTELDAKKEKKARLECAAGNFREGVRLLAELWLDTKDPTHIYNQARCYEQSAQNAAAAARFIEYLRKAGPLQADDVKAIEKRIEELERKPGSTAQPTVIVMPAPAAAAPATAPLATAAPAPQTGIADAHAARCAHARGTGGGAGLPALVVLDRRGRRGRGRGRDRGLAEQGRRHEIACMRFGVPCAH